jgi:dipeptidyl aminopeptidase/acylaminoacyl peptidase
MVRPLIWFALALAASAQTAGVFELLDKTILYQDPAISPDGQYVAWTETRSSPWSPEIHIAAVAGGSRPVTVHSSDLQPVQTEPSWSPDSTQLAFLSAPSGQPQVWTVSRNGSHAKQWTQLNGYAAHPRWSHDGRSIAFLYIEGTGGGGPLNAAPVRTGVIDEQIRNQRIAILSLRSGEVRQVSPANLHVYDYDWSPDDSTFVATAAPGPGDNNWWIAQLYTFQAATGEGKSIYKPEYQLATPRWSPDGTTIAFIEGLMSDEGFHGGDLFTIAASGGTPVNRTKGRPSSPSAVYWAAPDRIVFTEWSGGGSAISELSMADSSIRTLWQGPEGIHGFGNFPTFSLSRDGAVFAVVRSTFATPPEVWAGPAGNWRQITNRNADLKPLWAKAESLEWSGDGFRNQGWLLPPRNVVSGKRYPMVVLVHGGPSGSETSAWPAMFGFSAALSAQGYYVLMPNPRGSYGQGEQFTRANIKDFGGGDLHDILAGVDHAIAHYPVDPNRVGITGWSYGGYMTMWAVTQTNRFRAAMAGAGVANWQSYYGQNLIDRWMIPFFGASVYDDPAVYAKSSPIQFIKNVKTPTLVIVGERDAECPAPQSYEFWHALHTLGVTTELVVYAGEGHMFIDPKNRNDALERTVAWFDRYLR